MVKKGDICPTGRFDGRIGSPSNALILRQDDRANAFIALAIILDELCRAGAFAAIINKDEFPMGVGLPNNGLYRSPEIIFIRPPCGAEDGDKRSFFEGMSLPLEGGLLAKMGIITARPTVIMLEVERPFGDEVMCLSP